MKQEEEEVEKEQEEGKEVFLSVFQSENYLLEGLVSGIIATIYREMGNALLYDLDHSRYYFYPLSLWCSVLFTIPMLTMELLFFP